MLSEVSKYLKYLCNLHILCSKNDDYNFDISQDM